MLERLRESYEQDGYEFFLQPSPNLLPRFLSGFRPDAIALKGDEKLIIEVKASERPQWSGLIKRLSEAMKGHPDWQLRLHTYQPATDDVQSIPIPDPALLRERVKELEALCDSGHARAALLLSWSILEAIVRGIMSARGLHQGGLLSRRGIVQFLEMDGLVTGDEIAALRRQAELGNRVAHGDLTVTPDPVSARWLIGLVRILAGQSVAPDMIGDAHQAIR